MDNKVTIHKFLEEENAWKTLLYSLKEYLDAFSFDDPYLKEFLQKSKLQLNLAHKALN